MLELYDSKFIITTDDGKMINCYSNFEDALVDAKDVVKNQNIEHVFIYEQLKKVTLGKEFLQKIYQLKEKVVEETPVPEEKEEKPDKATDDELVDLLEEE